MTTLTDLQILDLINELDCLPKGMNEKGNGVLSDDAWVFNHFMKPIRERCPVATHLTSNGTHYGFAVWDETIQIEETTLGRCLARLLLALHEDQEANPNRANPVGEDMDYTGKADTEDED